jgi:hypothetical protein
MMYPRDVWVLDKRDVREAIKAPCVLEDHDVVSGGGRHRYIYYFLMVKVA